MKYPHTTLSVQGCECEGCERVRARRRKRAKNTALHGTHYLMDVGPVRRHIKALLNAGWTQRDISVHASVAQGSICEIASGLRRFGGDTVLRKSVRTSTAERILRLKPSDLRLEARHRVPALGSTRRLRALACMGWGLCDFEAYGLGDSNARDLRQGLRKTTLVEIAVCVEKAFIDLCMTPAPEDMRHDAVRRNAAANGWLPPLAWDDIDDPNEIPDMDPPEEHTRLLDRECPYDDAAVIRALTGNPPAYLSHQDRLEITRRGLEGGKSYNFLARNAGVVKVDRYVRELRDGGWTWQPPEPAHLHLTNDEVARIGPGPHPHKEAS